MYKYNIIYYINNDIKYLLLSSVSLSACLCVCVCLSLLHLHPRSPPPSPLSLSPPPPFLIIINPEQKLTTPLYSPTQITKNQNKTSSTSLFNRQLARDYQETDRTLDAKMSSHVVCWRRTTAWRR